ncbi:MAG TPA: hypothetical protein VE011_06935 [Candidatus Dormibacteraeota bacterium]|nr:hypothetical protein [Candidatus Dormibacteraeota bacterium]
MIRRDRDPLEDERAAARLTTEVVRPPIDEGLLPAALGVVVALVVVAILKPWAWGTPAPTGLLGVDAGATAEVTPIPTEDRSAAGLAGSVCLGTGGWTVASLETWRTQDVRVWRAVEPVVSATGPLDPSIPSVPIVAIKLSALGWCAPGYGRAMPVGPADVTAWTVQGSGAVRLELRQVRPVDGITPIAALYVPLTRCTEPTICASLLPAPVPRPWTTERVVFHYQDEGTPTTAWFAADITILPAPESPPPSPTGTLR